MKLIYIHHSSFVIEGNKASVLIDYEQDTPEAYVHRQFLNSPGRLYILASHAHPDHFNPEILEWRADRPDIRYIFSEDIRETGLSSLQGIQFLQQGEEWQDDYLKVKAFGSTDLGISFLLEMDHKRIFHAGDLNNWHWEEESSAEEAAEAEQNYLKALEELARYTDEVDLALFPVDPRLGKDYTRGARQFISRIRTRHFAPMHFWQQYDKANAFRKDVEHAGGRFIALHRMQETATLEN